MLFFLGKRSLRVLRFASCEAIMEEVRLPDTEASCLHEKHSIVLFFLGKRSLRVLRFASCEAIMEEVRLPRTPKRA